MQVADWHMNFNVILFFFSNLKTLIEKRGELNNFFDFIFKYHLPMIICGLSSRTLTQGSKFVGMLDFLIILIWRIIYKWIFRKLGIRSDLKTASNRALGNDIFCCVFISRNMRCVDIIVSPGLKLDSVEIVRQNVVVTVPLYVPFFEAKFRRTLKFINDQTIEYHFNSHGFGMAPRCHFLL